jgi:hypothetical protein
LGNPGIVRHRGKIEATIGNARAYLNIERQGGFAEFIWSYVDGVPIQNRFVAQADVPAKTELSAWLSKDLRRPGSGFADRRSSMPGWRRRDWSTITSWMPAPRRRRRDGVTRAGFRAKSVQENACFPVRFPRGKRRL